MKTIRFAFVALLLLIACVLPLVAQQVVATGFNNPRNLRFGPDGSLYVAEGGAGGNLSTVGQCEQAAGPPAGPGPYLGGFTARISKVNVASGAVSTVAEGLPSSQTSDAFGDLVSGVADIAFINGTLYALISGAGCSHGLAGTHNGIVRINSNGTWSDVANLSEFQMAHPVANPQPADFEPDGTWYSMVAVRGALYAVEPNHGELDMITTDGQVRRIADISASQGHIVPTAIAYHGNFYIGNLHTFPIEDGSSKIIKINPGGEVKAVATGFTTVLGLVFDNRDRMYVLENTTGNPFPTPGTGKVLRVDPSGKVTEIATGLFLPTGMTMGPDGNLYVSQWGFGPPPIGMGQVIKIKLGD